MKQRKFAPVADSSSATPTVAAPASRHRQLAPAMPLPDFRRGRQGEEPKAEAAVNSHEGSEVPVAAAAKTPVAAISSAGRTLQDIRVDLIDANPLAPREVYTPEMILERAEDLRNQGQHDPIHVIPNPDVPGRFVICDGWTRVQACVVHLVQETLLAEIHGGLTLQEAAWFGYEQNEGRQQHCDLDRAMFYEKLIAHGESANEVARRAKLSKTLMSFYRAYAKLPPDVLEIVREHPDKVSATIASQLAKLYDKCGQRRTVVLCRKFVDEDHTRTWLVSQVQSYLNPGEHKAAAPSKQIRYSNGFFKQRGDVFEVSIAVADDKRAEFADALEALLDTVAEKTPEPPAEAS